MSKFNGRNSPVWARLRRHALWTAAGAAGLAGTLAVLPVQAELGEQSLGATQAAPESTGVYYVYPGRPRVWISNHGNILRFEGPQGYDHIGVGELSEGYVLCYNGRTAWDVGFSESGFRPGSASCFANSCTFTRTTTDGQFQLRQVIWKDQTERALNVEMTLQKLGQTQAFNVRLRRQVDLDVDAGGAQGTGSFINRFATTERESVWAWNATNDYGNEGHAVMLRQIIRTPGYVPYWAKVTSRILDTSCSPRNLAEDGPVQGDYGATLQYDVGTMGQGSVFTGRVQYQRN